LATVDGVLAGHDINIEGQLLATRSEHGYVVTDIGVADPGDVPQAVIQQLCDLPGTVRLRVC
jgi:D-3-phosphoglycerate dehydrogenase